MSHEQSPLTLLSHQFISFSCEASRDKQAEGSLSLNTEQNISQNTEDSSRWMIELEVEFESAEENNPSPYTGKIVIQGHFQIYEKFKENNREALICVTAASMLYGACREMLANFTARSSNGMLVLPSVSFRAPKHESDKDEE